MDERRKRLEAFVEQLKSGNPLSDEFVKGFEIPVNKYNEENLVAARAFRARNLAEDALANEVLKNTGIPIPNDKADRLKKEDFLKRLIQEQYPELKIGDDSVNMGLLMEDNYDGIYDQSGNIHLKNRPNIIKNTSTALHEAAHKYDDDILKFDGTPDVLPKNMRKMASPERSLRDLDPTEAYEFMAKGHHAEIPNLREGSFGLGALKSYLKSGAFKSVAPIIAKGTVAAAGGLASLASEAADSEDAGGSSEQAALLRERDEMVRRRDNFQNAAPQEAEALKQMYNELDSGKAFDARRDALMKLKRGL